MAGAKSIDPTTQLSQNWTERVVVVVQATAYQAGLRRLREQALARLTSDLLKLVQPPSRGRKRYLQEADLAAVVAKRIGEVHLEGVVQTALQAWALPDGSTALVATYHQQPVHERSFSRLKTRNLRIRPVYVRDETRMAGMVWLLCLALRVLVLTEQRLRAALQEKGGALVGLNPASRTQETATPTTERVIRGFRNLSVTVVRGEGWEQRHISSLNESQQHILTLLGLPSDLSARLGQPPGNLTLQMRE